jgi:hypothetical protein
MQAEMNEKDLGRDLLKRQKEIWLKLADAYLRNSDNEFLKRFGDYLEEGYKGSKQMEYGFNEPSWATKQQTILKKMLDFEAVCIPSMQKKGCALIGKTDFNKLDFIKNYFEVSGLSEFTGNETAGHYAVVDCSNIRRYNGLIKALVKNQDVTYVIFDNCDSLLRHDGALQAFKQLSEDYPGITVITKNDESVNFKTDSFFMFFGEENTLHIAVKKQIPKGLGASAYNHFDAFIHYIPLYDFDKGERYYGHDVTPIC